MSVLDALDGITLQALATAIALVLSVITFARQELGKRAAELTVTCERRTEDKWTHTDVVVHNSGPATARGLEVEFLTEEGEPVGPGMRVDGTPVDLPAGHGARLRYSRSLGSYAPTIRLTWTDRRRGARSLEAPFNEVIVPGTPVVNVQVGATQPNGPTRRGPFV